MRDEGEGWKEGVLGWGVGVASERRCVRDRQGVCAQFKETARTETTGNNYKTQKARQ